MSKNISIKEGDVARKFRPVDRLNIITDNAPAMWKPEDTFRTGTLHVSENGIYIASLNGYAAYDEIDVRVTDKVGSIDPSDYDYITPDMDFPDVWDESALDFDEDELNDPDEWPDYDDYDDSDETDYDPYDPESSPEDFDPKKVKPKKIKFKNPKEKKIKGVDPVSGQEYEVTATEPEGEVGDTELSSELLPSAIHIVVPPFKREYEAGETIDFTGIKVYLMDDRYRRFTTEQYPTGEIPFSELIFPVTTAEAGSGGYKKATSDIISGDITFSSSVSADLPLRKNQSYWDLERRSEFSGTSAVCWIKEDNDNYTILFADTNETNGTGTNTRVTEYIDGHTENVVAQTDYELYGSYTYNEDKVYYGANTFVGSQNYKVYPGYNEKPDYGKIAWTMVYGNIEDVDPDSRVPVQWMRSDGKTLEDTFSIKVGEGGEPEPEPQNDPFANSYDFEWEGKYYNFNRKLAEGEVIYSDGTVYQTWIGGQSPPYTVSQAVSMKLCFQVNLSGSTHLSGGF